MSIKTITTMWAHARLVLDILSMRLFVWRLGHQGELLDSHLFFFDRYSDLADYHRSKGRSVKADRLTAVAEWYFDAAPDDDDPEAAAMAMPIPRPRIRTNAVSAGRLAPHRRTGRRSETTVGLARPRLSALDRIRRP